jgi:hypothetical protein
MPKGKYYEKDILGKKFGKLKPVDISHVSTNQYRYWNMLCECGKYTKVRRSNLNRTGTKSCGCSRNNASGLYDSNFYKIYKDIKSICRNKNVKRYKLYGARGVDYSWKSFNEFKTEMYNLYKSLDSNRVGIRRYNKLKDFSKDNCYFRKIGEK